MKKAKLKQTKKLKRMNRLAMQIKASDARIAAIDEGLAGLAPSVADQLLADMEEETGSGRWVVVGLVVRITEEDCSSHGEVISSYVDNKREELVKLISHGGLPLGFIAVDKKDAEDPSHIQVQIKGIPEVFDDDIWEYLGKVAVEWQEWLQQTWQEILASMAVAVLERNNDAVAQGLHGEVGQA